MGKDKRVYTSRNPGWINSNYLDLINEKDFNEIFNFFVINTLCKGLSSRSKRITYYGWNKNVYRKRELRNKLFSIADLEKILC